MIVDPLMRQMWKRCKLMIDDISCRALELGVEMDNSTCTSSSYYTRTQKKIDRLYHHRGKLQHILWELEHFYRENID